MSPPKTRPRVELRTCRSIAFTEQYAAANEIKRIKGSSTEADLSFAREEDDRDRARGRCDKSDEYRVGSEICFCQRSRRGQRCLSGCPVEFKSQGSQRLLRTVVLGPVEEELGDGFSELDTGHVIHGEVNSGPDSGVASFFADGANEIGVAREEVSENLGFGGGEVE